MGSTALSSSPVLLKRSQVPRPFLSSASNLLFSVSGKVLIAAKGIKRWQELLGNNVEGVLALKNPWQSIARTIYQDHKRYLETYMKVIYIYACYFAI